MYEIFEKLLKEKGLSIAEFSRQTGLSKSTLSDWKKGKFQLKEDKRRIIAQYFNVSLSYLDGRSKYRRTYGWEDAVKTFENNNPPVYDISAGRGRLNEGYPTEWMDTTEDSDEYSWCTIHGDSMYPRLYDGDLIRVHHQTETSPRDLTVVKIDGDAVTVKYVEITKDGVWLRAENKDVFEDKFYSVQQVLTLPIQIVGRVVEMRRAL